MTPNRLAQIAHDLRHENLNVQQLRDLCYELATAYAIAAKQIEEPEYRIVAQPKRRRA